MENSSDNINIESIQSEMSELNQGTNNTNEKLDTLIDLIEEQQDQYNQDKADSVLADEAKTEAEIEAAQKESEAETARAEQEQQTTETYTELLEDIKMQQIYTNNILVVNCVMIGIVCGLLLAKIFIDRMFK